MDTSEQKISALSNQYRNGEINFEQLRKGLEPHGIGESQEYKDLLNTIKAYKPEATRNYEDLVKIGEKIPFIGPIIGSLRGLQEWLHESGIPLTQRPAGEMLLRGALSASMLIPPEPQSYLGYAWFAAQPFLAPFGAGKALRGAVGLGGKTAAGAAGVAGAATEAAGMSPEAALEAAKSVQYGSVAKQMLTESSQTAERWLGDQLAAKGIQEPQAMELTQKMSQWVSRGTPGNLPSELNILPPRKLEEFISRHGEQSLKEAISESVEKQTAQENISGVAAQAIKSEPLYAENLKNSIVKIEPPKTVDEIINTGENLLKQSPAKSKSVAVKYVIEPAEKEENLTPWQKLVKSVTPEMREAAKERILGPEYENKIKEEVKSGAKYFQESLKPKKEKITMPNITGRELTDKIREALNRPEAIHEQRGVKLEKIRKLLGIEEE